MTDIEVVIDGLPTPVDADAWEQDPGLVTKLVRDNRAELRKEEGKIASFLGNFTGGKTEQPQTVAFGLVSSSRTSYQGKRVNEKTRQILEAANSLLASSRFGSERGDITLVQGSYNGGGVSASAGTHDGGGAGDITSHNYQNRVKVLRLLGCAAWYRPAMRNVWSAHIHFIVIGDDTVSRGGKVQVTAYKNNRNGLANNAKDPDWRPAHVNIRFVGNADVGVHYTTRDAHTYSQPYGSVSKLGALRKGTKFTVVAKVTNSYGNKWAVNVSGKWLPMSALTKTKPAKPVEAKKSPLRIGTQNFGQNNTALIKKWTANRSAMVNLIHSKNLDVLFTQELPKTPRDYVEAKLKALRSTMISRGGPGYGRYIFTKSNMKHIAGNKWVPSAKYKGAIKPISWVVLEREGVRYLFVDGHAQSGSTEDIVKVRTSWISQVLAKADQVAKKYKVDEENIIFGGDWNGYGEIVRAMNGKGYVSTHATALKKINTDLKTHHKIGESSEEGRPIDMLFVFKTRKVSAHNNRLHKLFDHNLVIAVVV